VLAVSRSGYYVWASRKPSRRSYEPKRLQKELQADSCSAGVDRIKRLSNKLGLRCAQRRTFKATTNANHPLPIAPKGWLYLAGSEDLYTADSSTMRWANA
jgi:transposase InsO family protein